MTTHGALVCRVRTRPHPNADRLLLGQVGGFQVVVGNDTPDGQLGLFFSSELQLSPEFAAANDLYDRGTDPETGKHLGGYFGPNANVRAQNFRGEKSEGFFIEIDSIDRFYDEPLCLPAEGSIITEWNGIPLCYKKASSKKHNSGPGGTRTNLEHGWFRKNVDIEQFGYYGDKIPPGSVVTLTNKMHGTSGRTALLPVTRARRQGRLARLFRRPVRTYTDWQLWTGSRNVVIDDGSGRQIPTQYGDNGWRSMVGEVYFGGNELLKGETVFYEIVGYLPSGAPIMSEHDFTKTKEYKKYGRAVYAYGQPVGTCGVYVYRITQTVEDAFGNPVAIELSWPQVKRRCEQMGVKHVGEPVGDLADGHQWVVDGTFCSSQLFAAVVADVNDGPDPLDGSHPKEGVVVRVDTPDGDTYFLKSKGMAFKIGEGIVKEQADYDDMEEAA